MQDELALLQAIWPLLLLVAVAFFLIWRNLGSRTHQNPPGDSAIDQPARRSDFGNDGGGGGGDGD